MAVLQNTVSTKIVGLLWMYKMLDLMSLQWPLNWCHVTVSENNMTQWFNSTRPSHIINTHVKEVWGMSFLEISLFSGGKKIRMERNSTMLQCSSTMKSLFNSFCFLITWFEFPFYACNNFIFYNLYKRDFIFNLIIISLLLSFFFTCFHVK